MATSGEKKSSISNILTTDQISSRAIIELNHEKNSEVFESLPKIDIVEFSEHEKYGMLAQVRYKVRGTSLVRVENLFVDEKMKKQRRRY
ncbi:MAG: hypothetical protein ACRC6T_14030 [Sarcina sp.]